jgi:CHAD domain-containing protein
MKKEEIIEYVQESFKKIHKLSGNIIKDFDEEEIHEFRKEIKRVRAFLRLLSVDKAEEDKQKITKKLKTFYGYVGIIRNLQLQQKNISEQFKSTSDKFPDAYFKTLIKEMENWEGTTREYMDIEKDFYNDEEKTLEQLPEKITKSVIVRFINHEISELMSLAMSESTDDNIHSIRKILKDLQYNWEFIKKYNLLLPLHLGDEKEIKSFTDLLGDFHDKVVSLGLLHSYNTFSAVVGEKFILSSIEDTWEKEKKEFKATILEKLDSIKYSVHKAN